MKPLLLVAALLLTLAAFAADKQAAAAKLQPLTGQELKAMMRQPQAPVTLVNLWATWCGPCVQEFPHLVDLQKQHRDRGLRLVFVSMDAAAERPAVEKFLAQQKVDFTTYLKSGDDNAFLDNLPSSWSGALPATWIIDAGGKVRQFWQGEVPLERFDAAILPLLKDRVTKQGEK